MYLSEILSVLLVYIHFLSEIYIPMAKEVAIQTLTNIPQKQNLMHQLVGSKLRRAALSVQNIQLSVLNSLAILISNNLKQILYYS